MRSERCRHSAPAKVLPRSLPSFSDLPHIRGSWLPVLLALVGCGGASPGPQAPALRAQAAETSSLNAEAAASSPASASPYAPERVAPNRYEWKRALGILCVPAKPATLHFNGSVAQFPLLPDDDASKPAAVVTVVQDASTPDTHTADTIVASLRPRFRSCFAQLQERRGSAQGSARLTLDLACSGAVAAITAETQQLDDETVACLFALVAPTTFPPPPGGHGSLQLPVVFRSNER